MNQEKLPPLGSRPDDASNLLAEQQKLEDKLAKKLEPRNPHNKPKSAPEKPDHVLDPPEMHYG